MEVTKRHWVIGVITDMGKDTYSFTTSGGEEEQTPGMQVTTYKFFVKVGIQGEPGTLVRDKSQYEVLDIVYPNSHEDVR